MREKSRLKSKLGDKIIIEHVGSTAVPGLGGKGFIDIAIGTKAKNFIKIITNKLIKGGYNYEPDASTDERIYLDRYFKDKSGNKSMYHIHLTFLGSKDWKEMLTFRNYLKANRSAFNEYALIKKTASQNSSQEREKYVAIKNPVIVKLLKEAMKCI